MHIIAKKIGSTLSYDPAPLRKYLEKQKDGAEFLVIVCPISEEKSREALGYYWKAMIDHLRLHVEQFGGWTKHEIHNWIKAECAEGMDVSEMDQPEFSAYLDRCKIRLAQEGIYILSPAEWYKSLKGEKP